MTTGCLVLHGLGGEPFEVLELAGALEKAGYIVSVPLLSGHGAGADVFARSGYDDWLASAKQAYLELSEAVNAAHTLESSGPLEAAAKPSGTPFAKSFGKPGNQMASKGRVVVIGFSLGGILALDLAGEFAPAAVISLAAPLYPYRLWPPPKVKDWRVFFMPLLANFVSVIKHSRRPSAESRRMAPWKGHEGAYFLRPLLSMSRACKRLRGRLHMVKAPLLLMHDRNDSISEFSNVFEIAGRCASGQIEIRTFELREKVTSKHMLVTHEQSKHLVCEYALDFIKRVLADKKTATSEKAAEL